MPCMLSKDDKILMIKLGPEDILDVMELENICFSYHWSEEQFKLGLERGAYHIFGLREGGRLIGYMAFSTIELEMEVLNLGVHPDYRRKGYGDLLLREVMATCEKMGFENAFLDVRVNNKAAISLYEKHGFIKYGVRKKYYPDTKEDALLYRFDFINSKETT